MPIMFAKICCVTGCVTSVAVCAAWKLPDPVVRLISPWCALCRPWSVLSWRGLPSRRLQRWERACSRPAASPAGWLASRLAELAAQPAARQAARPRRSRTRQLAYSCHTDYGLSALRHSWNCSSLRRQRLHKVQKDTFTTYHYSYNYMYYWNSHAQTVG